MTVFDSLENTIGRLRNHVIPEKRKEVLQPLIAYVQNKVSSNEEVNLNFICTHNSRRSQLAEIWATVASYYFNVKINACSGGTETTAFHINAINALRDAGFKITIGEKVNPNCFVKYNELDKPIVAYSKLYDSESNRCNDFAAVMTCSDAEANCPFIPGAEQRISLLYDDPKEFDGTPREARAYQERSDQIGAEMLHVFSKIK
jgi:arsenate reductase